MSIFEKRRRLRQIEDEARSLREDIRRAEYSCVHIFSEPKQVQVGSLEQVPTGRVERQGSDIWPEYDIRTVYHAAWERECVKCGKVEQTTRTKPTGVIADFGS